MSPLPTEGPRPHPPRRGGRRPLVLLPLLLPPLLWGTAWTGPGVFTPDPGEGGEGGMAPPSQVAPPLLAGAPPSRARSGTGAGAPGPDTLQGGEVRGVIRDEAGRPIAGVRVELRRGDERIVSTFSDTEGQFRLRLPPRPAGVAGADPGPFTLHLERLGYRSRLHDLAPPGPVDPGGPPLLLVMETAPLPLPGFRVEAAMEACPARSQEEARALWAAMARRHPGGLDTLGAATYTLVRTDTLAMAAVPSPGEERLVAGQRGFSGRLHLAWERRVDREGYAFPVRRTDPDGSYDAWSYAPMEADFASHFATPRFLEYHRLRAPSPSGDGGWILAFCPPDEGRPALEGHLELSPDTLLVRAEWRFRTPEPHEDAGGWTRFPGMAGSAAPLLLPLESVTWRTLREGGVQRRAQWYEAWIVTPGDSVPFLPERPATPPEQPDGVDPSPLLR